MLLICFGLNSSATPFSSNLITDTHKKSNQGRSQTSCPGQPVPRQLRFAWSFSLSLRRFRYRSIRRTARLFVAFLVQQGLRHTRVRVLPGRGEPRSSLGQRIASLRESGDCRVSSSLPASLLSYPPPSHKTTPRAACDRHCCGCCLLDNCLLLSLRALLGTSSSKQTTFIFVFSWLE